MYEAPIPSEQNWCHFIKNGERSFAYEIRNIFGCTYENCIFVSAVFAFSSWSYWCSVAYWNCLFTNVGIPTILRFILTCKYTGMWGNIGLNSQVFVKEVYITHFLFSYNFVPTFSLNIKRQTVRNYSQMHARVWPHTSLCIWNYGLFTFLSLLADSRTDRWETRSKLMPEKCNPRRGSEPTIWYAT